MKKIFKKKNISIIKIVKLSLDFDFFKCCTYKYHYSYHKAYPYVWCIFCFHKIVSELCPNTCLNGGQCIAENQCSCPGNYNGHRCENLSTTYIVAQR